MRSGIRSQLSYANMMATVATAPDVGETREFSVYRAASTTATPLDTGVGCTIGVRGNCRQAIAEPPPP